jgi:hypothetical protein
MGIPLYGLESKHALADFDILGFTLPYESLYTNVLNMLDLAGCRYTAPTERPTTRWSSPAGMPPSTPSQWRTLSTPLSSAKAKR